MKKYLYFLSVILSMAMVFPLVSCGSDDDDDDGVPDSKSVYLTCPDNKHPHMIDLGLPSGTKWACCNVGATTPEGYGSYYAWGETEEKEVFNEMTYQFVTGTDKYGDGWYDLESEVWQLIGSEIAGTEYDVAHVKWRGSWVMPSLDQIEELLDNCISEWVTENGVKGTRFTGSNGGSIFLPAAGERWQDELNFTGFWGIYWSSTQDPSEVCAAYTLRIRSDGAYSSSHELWRWYGSTVRPVHR